MPRTNQDSPTLLERAPSPPHTFPNAQDIALAVLSPPRSTSRTSHPTPVPETSRSPPAEPETSQQTTDANTEEDALQHNAGGMSDDSSNPDSNTDTSTSTETPGTVSTPRSTAQDSGMPVPTDDATQSLIEPEEQAATVATTEDATTATDQPSTPEQADQPAQTSESPERSLTPPPPEPEFPIRDDVPEWVKYEDDESTPNEEELKAIESQKELDASIPKEVEKIVFSPLSDPEYRPSKKIRLSWTIKGVRGTREKPNRTRVMSSPPVLIDGHYWNIKFFPRGNKSRSSLSAFIRCSPNAPDTHSSHLEGSFKAWEVSPDEDFSAAAPILELELTPPVIEEEAEQPEPVANGIDGETSTGVEQPAVPAEPSTEDASTPGMPPSLPPPPSDPQDDDDDESSEDEDIQPKPPPPALAPEFRVSAQLGMVIYNPLEPRTNQDLQASHQFCRHQDDWGWDSAVSHWDNIHRRKHGQRQALLQRDTLVVDAYIRIFEDSTKALFWHPSSGEQYWDSKSLADLFPFGTKLLYHSPATAGIASWFCLAPMREVVQQVHTGKWQKDSKEQPRPLLAQLQLMLYQMRHMKDDSYIHLDHVIHELTRPGEFFNDVRSFWEVFRRALELELGDDTDSKHKLQKILGDRSLLYDLPLLPVKTASSIQAGVEAAFTKPSLKRSFPDFLPLMLDRQSFDAASRQWKLHHDRVKIDDELDLSSFSNDEDAKYTLYGFIVHDGERTSGKFFSVLRPHGRGGKWLQFTDGHGNKVHSLTQRKVEEFFGLESAELRNASSSTQTAYMALYIRSSRISEYLVEKLEPYRMAQWLKPWLEESCDVSPENFAEEIEIDDNNLVNVEVFWDRSIAGVEGKIDLTKMKINPKAQDKQNHQVLKAHPDNEFRVLKEHIADVLGMSTTQFKLWCINYYRSGALSKGRMYLPMLDTLIRTSVSKGQNFQLWLAIKPVREGKDEEEKEMYEAPAVAPSDAATDTPADTLTEAPTDAAATTNVETDAEAPAALVEDHNTTDQIDENLTIEERFLRLSEIVIEAPPKPDPVPETTETNKDASDDWGLPASLRDQQAASWTEPARDSNNTTSADETGADTEEQAATADEEQTANTEDTAAPDEEQESVQQAVQASTDTTGESSESTTSPNEDTPESESREEQNQESAADEEQASIQEAIALSLSNVSDEDLNAASVTSTEHATNAAASQLEDVVPVTNQAPSSTIAAPILPDADLMAILNGTIGQDDVDVNETLELPVEHGHLVDAAEHESGQSRRPLTAIITAGDNQIVIIQNSTTGDNDDISAEDAALIQSMIAEDLAATERRRGDGTADDNEDDVTDSRSSTPQQKRVPEAYGFLQVFDAKKQTFITHGMFTWPHDQAVSAMVRKELEFDEEHKFRIWKRSGTFATTAISLESSFKDVSVHDCSDIIVGEELEESETEELKARGEFVEPSKLMRYMAMKARGHPTLALTSTEPIEINDFGGDYYRGPLARGQRHGPSCTINMSNGSTYAGPLTCGLRSGPSGIMTYENGDTYHGDWLDDQRHGQGEFIEKRTGNRYVGGYENDKRWGKGTTYWEVADQQADLCQICYFNEVDVLFYKCGHICACYECAKQCDCCPICRKSIEAVVKMYRS